MVANHWSDNGMVTIHRSGLLHCIKLLDATYKRVYFVCFVNSFLYLRTYLSQYIRRCLHHNTEAPSEFFSKPPWTGAFAFSFFLLEPSLLSLLAIFQLRCWSVFLWNAKVPYVKKKSLENTLFFLSTNSDRRVQAPIPVMECHKTLVFF